MANIITSKFRSDSVSFFFDDLENNNYFLFGSSAVRTAGDNSLISTNDFLEKTIFGKEIVAEENFFYLIKNYPWQINEIYDQYDDAINFSDKKYYSVVYPQNNATGDFRIYKCLFNNYGASSLFPPTDNENNGDEYIWELMYILSETDFEKYNTLGYIPITGNTSLSNTSFATSTIDKIILENNTENNGYEVVFANTSGNLGSVNIVDGNYDDIVIEAKTGFELSSFINYYSGNTLYAFNTDTGSANVYIIDTYVYNPITRRAVVKLLGTPADDSIIQQGVTDIEILPTIEITGDGSGAIAIPEVVDGTITKIIMLARGSGYTRASARVVDQFGFDTTNVNSLDVSANLRAVLSPRGGHGANLVDELSCKHCLIYSEITEFDNNTFPITNTFSKIGIVKNPEFTSNTTIFDNRIQVEVVNTTFLIVNDQVDQVNTDNKIIFTARTHEISTDTNTVYLSEYHGPYQNQANTNFSIDSSIPLRNSQGSIIGINNITYPPYVPKSGNVYYMIDFFPIERTSDSRELFKIIIEF